MKKKSISILMLIFAWGLWGYSQRNRDTDPARPADAQPNQSATNQNSPATPMLDQLDSTSNANSPMKLASTTGSAESSSATTIPAPREKQVFKIKGLKPKQTNVHVAVFENEAGFPQPQHSSQTIIVESTVDEVSFSVELPLDQPIAVAVFQDLDGNGSLSKNSFGIPSEPYGFSNNARGSFGPPAFSQATFKLQQDKQRTEPMEIRIR